MAIGQVYSLDGVSGQGEGGLGAKAGTLEGTGESVIFKQGK